VKSSVPFTLQADDTAIVFGAGGHARSVVGVLRDIGCGIAGVLADGGRPGEVWPGIEWLGDLAQARAVLQRLPGSVCVMAIGDNYQRLRLLREIQADCPGARFPAVVHPSAVVAGDATLGQGVVLMPGAIVLAGCQLGSFSLVNTRASLDHEGVLAEGASLAPGAVTGGRVSIGRRSFIGMGAVVAQGVRIGDDTVLGAGALLLQDLPDRAVAYGSPARVVRARAVDEAYL
jgi:sugar O-acyltransferase (sialic acid O-acetyltransferase NeuD family)